MAALDLDFLTQVVNVQWNIGLAVEFGPEAEDAPVPAGSPTIKDASEQHIELSGNESGTYPQHDKGNCFALVS